MGESSSSSSVCFIARNRIHVGDGTTLGNHRKTAAVTRVYACSLSIHDSVGLVTVLGDNTHVSVDRYG